MQDLINKLHATSKLAEHLMAAIELVLIAIVGRLATWIAPLPSAILVGRSTAIVFELDGLWPAIMAGVVELIGLVTSSLWITAKEWNANKRKSDPDANERLTLALMSVYFVTTFLLLLSIELPIVIETHNPAGLTALLFPILSAVALVALNERAAQSKRQADYDASKSGKKPAMSGKKTAVKTTKTTGKSAATTSFTTVKTKDRAREILTERPDISGAELGRQLEKSASLGRQLKRELLPLLSGENGTGVTAALSAVTPLGSVLGWGTSDDLKLVRDSGQYTDELAGQAGVILELSQEDIQKWRLENVALKPSQRGSE